MSFATQEKRAWLAKVPLFRDCGSGILDQLADTTSEFVFSADGPIVQQGQVGNGLYILVTGGARVVAGSDELARFGPGDLFGELSVIDRQSRTASACAIGPTICLAMASWDLMAVLEREPRLAMNLLRELAGRLRRADVQLRY